MKKLLRRITVFMSMLFAYTVTGQVTFNYTGSMQTYTVPLGVTSVTVEAWGAQGGAGYSAVGGLGGYATGDLAVMPGQTLNIYVGGQGGSPTGGWNGGGQGVTATSYGGGGGGASDVRSGGTALTDRAIVAGGGGGGCW
jgi:hypothetical protein